MSNNDEIIDEAEHKDRPDEGGLAKQMKIRKTPPA